MTARLGVVACACLGALSLAPAATAEESAVTASSDPADRYCLYPSMVGGAPEIGPLPCDVARPYTIGVWDPTSTSGETDATAPASTDGEQLAVSWRLARDAQGRPTLQGYVVDLDGGALSGVRLRIEGIDASGDPVFSERRRIDAAALGAERMYFEVPVARPAATYRITVEGR